MYVLRKTFGPLSAGTPLVLVYFDDRTWERDRVNASGYATVKLANVSPALKEQIKRHPIHRQLLGAFDIEADLIVRRRNRGR